MVTFVLINGNNLMALLFIFNANRKQIVIMSFLLLKIVAPEPVGVVVCDAMTIKMIATMHIEECAIMHIKITFYFFWFTFAIVNSKIAH